MFESEDPLAALGALAGAWLDRLRQGGCRVIGITGSTGKTSTKDILLALAGPPFGGRVHANRENFNTEVGLPLTVLEAEEGTELIVLEMAMRGMGQIRDLARIAPPDVGVITNVGPVHLELVGTVERVARGEGGADRASWRPARRCVVPAGEEALRPHLRSGRAGLRRSLRPASREGVGGDRRCGRRRACAGGRAARRGAAGRGGGRAPSAPRSSSTSRRRTTSTNALAAIGALHALGVPLSALDEGARNVRFSSLRGEELELPDGVVIINDCYNANPVSMRAALDHLAAVADRRGARRVVAVLGDMRELGPEAPEFHREIGALAAEAGRGGPGRGGRARRRLRARVSAARRTRRRTRSGRQSWPPTSSGRATWCS